jgi:hypothetical protein
MNNEIFRDVIALNHVHASLEELEQLQPEPQQTGTACNWLYNWLVSLFYETVMRRYYAQVENSAR